MSRCFPRYLFVLTAACLLGSARSSFALDPVAGPMVIVKDTREEFRAIGSMTTTNPDTLFVVGANLTIAGVNWTFILSHDSGGWRTDNVVPPAPQNGANDAKISLDGTHLHGPHPPPAVPSDVDPNFLDEAVSKTADIPFNKNRDLAAYERTVHPTTGVKHHDHYSVKQECTALYGSPPNLLTGPTQVNAKHTGTSERPRTTVGLTTGSSSGAGSRVSYDAGTGQLTIHSGAMDILNRTGILNPGIGPEYLIDPLLNCQIGDVVLQFLGTTLDGGYRFGAGNVSLFDPQGELAIEGNFSEYLIYDTGLIGLIDSYASFDAMGTAHGGETCRSTAMDDLVDINMFGETLPHAMWLGIQALLLTFTTSGNLVGMTGGFTLSLFDVPATVAMTAGFSPEPLVGVPDETVETGVALGRSYPNPFTNGATIHYRVGGESPVRIEIFDPAGRLVRRLVDERIQPGDHSTTWNGTSDDGSRVSPGVYYYRLTVGATTQANRMVLLH